MAPALTAEPLNPKEKLTSTATPATGTRQSVRKLDAPSVGSGGVVVGSSSDTAKKPTTTVATVVEATTRVTRSKDQAAKRTDSPTVNNNNKRKSNNNNNNNHSDIKTAEIQMGLSAAATHASSSDGTAAAAAVDTTSSSGSDATAPAAIAAATAVAAAPPEHNNNCKDTTTAELLAHLTDFGEAITAEICLRKTLPELSISKEQPATPATVPAEAVSQLSEDVSMADVSAPLTQSLTSAEATTTATINPADTVPVPESLQQLVGQDTLPQILSSAELAVAAAAAAEITDNLEERLSQLDGSPNVVLPPAVEISAASLEASVPLPPTTPNKQQQPQLQPQDILTSPQHSTIPRQSTSALTLTPQSIGNNSSVNFLKDGTAGTVLEDPDIEEVLKALKTFDANQVNPDICDFNFFNDFAYNEEETAGAVIASTSGGGTITTTTAATAVARLDPEEKPSCSDNSIVCKPQRPLAECHAELELEQIVLDRRLDSLMRRMRKVQTRHMCRHASDEVAGILEWSARSSNKTLNAVPVRSAKLTAQEDTVLSVLSGRPGSKFWEEQTKHPLPASQMSNVLRHIETAARKQQICHTTGGGSASLASSSSWYSSAAQPGKRPRRSQPQHTIDGMPSTSQGAADAATSRTDEIVPNFDAYVTSELTQVAGMLQTEMREVQNAIDSDATESSSGGESADEMVNYNNSQQLSLPIARRAVWRYSRDRANIALRWSWLCAQVADLDIKIRQHNDVYNDLCRSEGRVVLESTPSPKNGYKEQQQQQQQQQQPQPMDTDQSTSGDHLCSRARPLILSEFRKRKLFQTTNMHTISKKAARPSNIKCGCQWPQVPCTLCTGRPDPTAPRDLPETLMPQNRVALLDPGYHPVLSFTEDVSQSVHLEAIARQPDWQYRVMRGQAKAIARSVFKAEREAIASNGGAGGRRPGEPVKRRAYVRRKERNNNNNKNNNNRSNSKDTTTTLQQLNNNNNNRGGAGGVGVNVGLVDSGNGTGTATTSTSTTPTTTTTPFGANSNNKRQHHQLATALPMSDSRQQQQQQQQLNNSTSVISSNGNGNGAIKKPRNSTNTLKQQKQAHNNTNNNNTHNKNINNNSRQATSGDNNNKNNNSRFNGDPKSGKQQQNNRRTSETQAQRTKERRNRLVYDIDNIVIPYSMAAQNRIELLPYKEIPTPKWRIVESDNDKKQVTDNTPKSNTKQLFNGCVKRQVALPDSGTKSKPPTAPATPASTTSTTKPEKDIKPVEVGNKPPVKINGTKLSSKEKKKKLMQKDNTKPAKQSEKPEQPLSNGLTNGKAEQKEKTVEQAKDTKVPAKEQLQQQQPAKPVPTKQPTPINGKSKIHKINNNIVNNVKKTNAVITAPPPASAKPTPSSAAISTPAVAAAPAIKDIKKVAVKPPVEPLEPPRKRPKLQLGPSEPLKPLKLPPPPSDNDAFEDISDEAYIVRHQRALLEERHRFETLLKFPYSKRSRSNRRTNSRAESSGANTPDPASPATPHLAGPSADNETIPSSKQAHPLDDVVMTAPKRQERRRTTSSKLKDHDRRSATPDVRDPHLPLEPPPFKPLQFPLSDEVNQQLLNQMYAPPPQQAATTVAAAVSHSKRSKSKSVSSSNGADGSTSNARSRRSSKAKATNPSKLAQAARTSRTQLMPKLNGSRNNLQHPVPHINGDNAVVKCEPEDDDEEEEEEDEDVEMLLDDDDDHHHLAPPDDDNLADSVAEEANLYDASIDAYIAETAGWLDEDEVPDDPFMDDDPNDPEWKRSIGVRMRKRM